MINVSRKLIVTTFISVLLFSAIVGVRFVTFVVANPIIPGEHPRLIMPVEYINVTISLVDGNLVTKVNGTYFFYSEGYGYDTVRMDYPLPPNATNISVKLNETSWGGWIYETWLNWTYNTKTYPTVIGDWPMINWTLFLSSYTGNLIIKTYYEHPIPIIDGNYTFLYAMGTGKYVDTSDWGTTAYINIRTEINHTDLHVYTVGFIDGTWTWNPVDYKITEENTTEIITLKIVSTPLKEDLFLCYPYFGNKTLEHDPLIGVESTTSFVTPVLVLILVVAAGVIGVALAVAKWKRKVVNIVGTS